MAKTIRAIKAKNIPYYPKQLLKRNNLALSLKIATLTIATLAIFNQDLAIVINDALQSEPTNYSHT
ncbi:MAG: hypothetical protein QMD13_09290 [Candidatus Bathyarchaeia archaeon]|nr:hypothetical protein [Candidatus Bathyarchaeia archaeon]